MSELGLASWQTSRRRWRGETNTDTALATCNSTSWACMPRKAVHVHRRPRAVSSIRLIKVMEPEGGPGAGAALIEAALRPRARSHR